jgi:hypothetical protein
MGFLNWLKRVFGTDSNINRTPDTGTRNSGMNQGDMHSGPEGYSPNTAYPDTFYGGGSSDDSSGHNEGDFNR